MTERASYRWMRRYKLFFILGLLIFGVQLFLAYKSFGIGGELNGGAVNTYGGGVSSSSGGLLNTVDAYRSLVAHSAGISVGSNHNSAGDDEESFVTSQQEYNKRDINSKAIITTTIPRVTPPRSTVDITEKPIKLTAEQLGFPPPCPIVAKEAVSALLRARTKGCRLQIATTACAIENGHFYPTRLSSHCSAGNYTANRLLGCYRDDKEYRLLPGYFINFKTTNTPLRCTQICLQSGFPIAGVQYGSECFCGIDAPPSASKLADSACNMKCNGDGKQICGGYFTMNVYETGIAKFAARLAETTDASSSIRNEEKRVRIAFLLTLNGRAVRQVHRLIRSLYAPQHFFYLHVDERQSYLYRMLLPLETKFSNIRLARRRFSTIWGGASLLTMLLQCMKDLLATKTWAWDFIINLSESDFPVKPVDQLVDFLSSNRDRNFVKGHGRETQRFIQKQGLDKTFVECDTHMWRIGDRQLPNGIQVDGGSDWVALSRPFIEYVTAIDEENTHDELLRGLLVIFQHTLLPAESFFHTVLRNSRFCDTYVDNNLHVTNWKRKLGCKCQYKHVVDWCGCSPNDFRPEDWNRLQGTERKMLFFARKFEPIINQAILLKLEEWLHGPYSAGYPGLYGYWQSLYDVAIDGSDGGGNEMVLHRSMGTSIMRLLARRFQQSVGKVIALTHYLHQDVYKGILIKYRLQRSNANKNSIGDTAFNHSKFYELETRIRPVQYVKLSKTTKFGKRLKNIEVSTDFDQKEQVARNFAKFMGPQSEPVFSFTFVGSSTGNVDHTYNITLLWIDPTGRLQDYNELHIEDGQTDNINFSKAVLRTPLQPGIWTVKMLGRNVIYAQIKFLVAPLKNHSEITTKEINTESGANGGGGLPPNFVLPVEWQQHLPSEGDVATLVQLADINAQRRDDNLIDWIDSLVGRFFHIRETCTVTADATNGDLFTSAQSTLPLCSETSWSSMAADPKSDIDALLESSETKLHHHKARDFS